jgi:hypothetical protein
LRHMGGDFVLGCGAWFEALWLGGGVVGKVGLG